MMLKAWRRASLLALVAWIALPCSNVFGQAITPAVVVDSPVQFRRDLLEDPAYVASLLSLAAAHSVDHASSLGQRELNPVLRNDAGGYSSGRGAALKASSTVGLVLIQRWMVRRHPRMRRPVIVMNMVLAGWFAGNGVRNYRLRGEVKR
jgi:hypothetical protein